MQMLLDLPHNSENPDKCYMIFLKYGCEAVLSLEIQILSLRVNLLTEMMNEEKHRPRLQELEPLDD